MSRVIFGEAQQFALLVLERRDDDVRPKLRAVLADPPALVLEATFGGGDLEFVGGPPPVDGLLRVKLREVLADDLVGLVALEPFGPGVPGDDPPLRVEHEDGVVRGPLNEQAKLVGLVPRPLLLQEQFNEATHLGLEGDRQQGLHQKVHCTEAVRLFHLGAVDVAGGRER